LDTSQVMTRLPSKETVRGSRTPGPRRPAALPQGETPYTPIRGYPAPGRG